MKKLCVALALLLLAGCGDIMGPEVECRFRFIVPDGLHPTGGHVFIVHGGEKDYMPLSEKHINRIRQNRPILFRGTPPFTVELVLLAVTDDYRTGTVFMQSKVCGG